MISGNSDGRLTIRTASDLNLERRPKLPQDALEFSIETTELVLDPENTSSDFEKILRETNEWNRYFPGYELLTISGIAQYELGEYELAYQSLVEAKRLEKILYGESDLRPSIEGYLALTCHHLNKPDMAERYLKEFTEKASVHRWFEDEAVARLIVKINSTMPNASRFSREQCIRSSVRVGLGLILHLGQHDLDVVADPHHQRIALGRLLSFWRNFDRLSDVHHDF